MHGKRSPVTVPRFLFSPIAGDLQGIRTDQVNGYLFGFATRDHIHRHHHFIIVLRDLRRFHRSVYDEIDDLKAPMDYLFQLAFEPMDDPMLPEGEEPGIVCLYPYTLNTLYIKCRQKKQTAGAIPGVLAGHTAISSG